jgi:hypothetical protein
LHNLSQTHQELVNQTLSRRLDPEAKVVLLEIDLRVCFSSDLPTHAEYWEHCSLFFGLSLRPDWGSFDEDHHIDAVT